MTGVHPISFLKWILLALIKEPPSTSSGSGYFNRFISWLQMLKKAPLPERSTDTSA
jgi:hypothetical protein